ncbi:nuclease domain containing protein [Colletotrichum kahawae]|uniref:Probable endonuclease LCL3 n=1 Tax=Colletotrichum kahawae TaxID=34407 RepID=A0AAD9YKC7_COLKA|nr:hypothetical protein CcaCcLH18_04888 [Colletotrichum camelliae]KAK2769377.1 nuclease domain containing protein [Colletotrichum kahawae]
MLWPFGSGKPEPPKEKKSIFWNDLLPQPDPPLHAAREWAPVFLTAVGSLAVFTLYNSRLRRYPTTGHISPDLFRKRTLFGRVTSVGDGDNFHMYHTPGGRLALWGSLRRVPTTRAKLKGKTIPVRLAGIDAPEGAHFGKPGQPGAPEALKWLNDYILNRRIWARIHKRDQYDRVVATVFVRPFLFKKDVGLEMLKRGLATTYEAKSGVEWGGFEQKYKAAEAKAKEQKLGIWAGKASDFESPRDYKTRVNEAGEKVVEDVKPDEKKKKEEKKKTWWFF